MSNSAPNAIVPQGVRSMGGLYTFRFVSNHLKRFLNSCREARDFIAPKSQSSVQSFLDPFRPI